MPDHLVELVHQATDSYRIRYGVEPDWIVAAPGRVNLIGEHIDYNDGFVLPMAIERYTVIAAGLARPTSERVADSSNVISTSHSRESLVSLYSDAVDELLELDLSAASASPSPFQTRDWQSYVVGVLAGLRERGIQLPAFRGVIHSDVPLGGGLSSSAALEVATATLGEAITGIKLDPREKALLCQQAEHLFAGVPCGIMDQFASVFGDRDTLLLVDCRSLAWEPIPLQADYISILVVNSNVRHTLAEGEYGLRRSQCDAALKKIGKPSWRHVTDADLKSDRADSSESNMTAVELRRARHVVSEIARTQEAASALRRQDWKRVGELMYESHQSLRDDFEVSCPELDLLVDIAASLGMEGGVWGSRMTGGGFGGCTVTLVETAEVPKIMNWLRSRYRAATGIDADGFVTRPAPGAHVVLSSAESSDH